MPWNSSSSRCEWSLSFPKNSALGSHLPSENHILFSGDMPERFGYGTGTVFIKGGFVFVPHLVLMEDLRSSARIS